MGRRFPRIPKSRLCAGNLLFVASRAEDLSSVIIPFTLPAMAWLPEELKQAKDPGISFLFSYRTSFHKALIPCRTICWTPAEHRAHNLGKHLTTHLWENV